MEFTGPTNQKHRVQCESSINHVIWGSTHASEGDRIKLDIGTSFMGRGSEVKLIFKDQRGNTMLAMTKPVYADRVTTTIDIPGKVKDHLVCEVSLSTNGKTKKSAPLLIVPPRSIHELNWSQPSVKRGDIVTLSAQTMGFIAGTKAIIHIYEHDEQGAHEPVAQLSTVIVNNKIELMWQFQYSGNTYDIPTEAERIKQNAHYQAPSYFWVAEVDGLRYGLNQNSGRLKFDSDELNIKLRGYTGLHNNDYVITLADGKQVKGKLNSDANITLTNIAPGPVEIVMANLVSANPQPLTEITPKGSLPLPGKLPNFQTEAANEISFTKGWGWRRFALLARPAVVEIVRPFLMSGEMKIERWKEGEYEYVYYMDDNIFTINKDQQTLVRLFIHDNDIIEVIGETPDHKLILGATVGVITDLGVVATIIAAMDDNDLIKWRIYKANGGEESFQVWGYTGKPLDVEVEYPVGVSGSKVKFSDLKQLDQKFVGEETGAVWGTKVKYLNYEERSAYKLHVKDGKLWTAQGKLFDTSQARSVFGGQGNAIFVMDKFGDIYASTVHTPGKFHHSSFLSGQPVASAGEVVVENGVLREVTRKSGHYQPTIDQLNQFLQMLEKSGVDLAIVIIDAGI